MTFSYSFYFIRVITCSPVFVVVLKTKPFSLSSQQVFMTVLLLYPTGARRVSPTNICINASESEAVLSRFNSISSLF